LCWADLVHTLGKSCIDGIIANWSKWFAVCTSNCVCTCMSMPAKLNSCSCT
jgi:hypothetical protein